MKDTVLVSTLGAPAALHGYRVQALYTLGRVLNQGVDGYHFQPEGLEDLDISDSDGQLLEQIQVKKYAGLQLADLKPRKADCFFRRALRSYQNNNNLQILLVNFGEIGPELENAWQGNEKARKTVRDKLEKYGYTESEIQSLFEIISLHTVDEKTEEIKVFAFLKDVFEGVDPKSAFGLLHFWIYMAMEQRKQIVYSDAIDRIQSVGQWLSERHNYYTQFYTTIQPLKPSSNIHARGEALQQEFYKGGYTTYDHIVSDLDFVRTECLSEIRKGFEQNNVVVIHAASGQGKTTLALRYLHAWYPAEWKFSIVRIENLQHALAAASALNGFAQAVQVPVSVYYDVRPNDSEWIEFVRQLAQHPYLRIIVTIREEDYKRTVSSTDFSYSNVNLSFNKKEAEVLYNRALTIIPQRRFLNFDEAWGAFRGGGPLLEFVYLITQTDSLRERLQGQVNRILNDIRERSLHPDEGNLLRLVAVATAHDARLSTQKLIQALHLPEPNTTLRLYEQEYLIRISDEGFIEGLHAVRSKILVELLTDSDIVRWIDLAQQTLPLIVEEDLEVFILNAAIHYPSEFENLRIAIEDLKPLTWSGLAGILRSALWIAIKHYAFLSKKAIGEAEKEFGRGWYFLTLLNSVVDDVPDIDRWWQSEEFSQLSSPERRERLDAIRDMQPSNVGIFDSAKKWLADSSAISQNPIGIQDWMGLAFVLYWSSVLETKVAQLPKIDSSLPLFVLADLLYALYKYSPPQYASWISEHDNELTTRFADEIGILYLERQEHNLKTHFLVLGSDTETEDESDSIHAATIQRLQLIRQIYPDYEIVMDLKDTGIN